MFRTLFILCNILFFFLIGVLKPIHNWDMIGYVASAYQLQGFKGEELREKTFLSVKAEVTEEEFLQLTSDDYDVRKEVFLDYNALEQHIPFFSIRVVYVGLMNLLNNLGLDMAKSTYFIGAFFSGLASLMVGLILIKNKLPIILLPLVLVLTGFITLSRLSSPDSIAAFVALTSIYFLQSKNNFIFIISACLPLIRTDFIILSFLLMSFKYWEGVKASSIISILVSLIIYWLVNSFSENYGWLTIFIYTLIDTSAYPAEINTSISVKSFLTPYLYAAYHLITHPHAVIYTISVFIAWKLRDKLFKDVNFYILLIIPGLFLISRMVLFPVYIDRHFIFAATCIFIWILSAIKDQSTYTK